MAHNRIYLCLAHMSGEEQKFIKEAFDTNWVVPLGPNVNGFEDDLKQFVDENKEIVALSAGTAAVHLALLACGVGPGDEVIVQSFTFCASSHPVTYLGATPVFVDSESESWNMDPVLLEQAIEDRIAKTGKSPRQSFLSLFTACPTGSMRSWRSPTNTKFPWLKMPQKDLGRDSTATFSVRSAATACFRSTATR